MKINLNRAGRRKAARDELDAADRLEAVLDTANPLCTDDDINRLAATARLLTPAVHPREAHRLAVKERMLRAYAAPDSAELSHTRRPMAVDGAESPSAHVAEVLDPGLGRVVLADLEHIDATRAAEVTRRIAAAIDAPVRTRDGI